MKPVCMISGPFFHHLDHLAPLAYFLDCPLFLDDQATYEMAKRYYPMCDARLEIIHLETLAKRFNCIIVTTKFARLELESAFRAMNINHMRFCFSPHGQSDKGMTNFEMRAIVHQDIALVYGERQKSRVLELPKDLAPKDLLIMGNARLAFYEKFRSIFDEIIEKEVFKLFSKRQQTLLYAPTWNDFEHSTSFFDMWKELIDTLPDHYNLVVKLHPFLEKNHPGEAYRCLSFHLCKPNIQVILEMPLIYPLLNQIDTYIGDYSAIGYDFLYFDRPLFFLGTQKVDLYDGGCAITNIQEIYTHLERKEGLLNPMRNKIYNNAFSSFNETLFKQDFYSLYKT